MRPAHDPSKRPVRQVPGLFGIPGVQGYPASSHRCEVPRGGMYGRAGGKTDETGKAVLYLHAVSRMQVHPVEKTGARGLSPMRAPLSRGDTGPGERDRRRLPPRGMRFPERARGGRRRPVVRPEGDPPVKKSPSSEAAWRDARPRRSSRKTAFPSPSTR